MPRYLNSKETKLQLVTHWRLVLGVRNEMQDFVHGFKMFVNPHHLRVFYPDEFDTLFCGQRDTDNAWSLEAIAAGIKFETG